MSAFMTQLRMECLHLIRSPAHLISLLSSAVLLYILLHFGMPASQQVSAALPALLLGTLIIALTYSTATAFEADNMSGRLLQWRFCKLTIEWLVTAKFLAYVLLAGLPLCLIFSLLLWIELSDSVFSYHAAIIMLLASASVIASGLFSAALSISFSRQPLSGALLCLPFTAAVIVFAAEALYMKSNAALYALSAISLILPVICCVMSAYLLKHT